MEFTHKVPGEYRHNGVLFAAFCPVELLEEVYEMKMEDDDVLVCSYPKSGTTWLSEMVWLILHDADTEFANKETSTTRTMMLEVSHPPKSVKQHMQAMTGMPQPRLLLTHLLYDMIPREAISKAVKMVVIMRNPKDVMVSFYHFYRMSKPLGQFEGTWDDFFKMFMENHMVHGDWFDHIQHWWDHRDDPNVLIVKYEEMKKSARNCLLRIATFLGKNLEEDQIDTILDHTDFRSMKNNKATNFDENPRYNKKANFYRKGEVGDWKNYFTGEQNDYFDKVFEEKMQAMEGLDFDFE